MIIRFEDFFEDYYINKSLGREKYYQEIYPKIIRENDNKIKNVVKKVLNINFRKTQNNHKKNIMIFEKKFGRIIAELSPYYNFYIISLSIKNCINYKFKQGNMVFNPYSWMRLVNKSFANRNMSYAEEAIDMAASYMEQNKIELLILGNDKLFIEKLLQYAAKKNNIPTVIIQHGVYNKDSFERLKTANTAEHFWVWSEYVKDLYRSYYPEICNDVRVIGYPFEIKETKKDCENAILFLGNQYAKYDMEEGKKYLEIAKNVYKACNELGIKFIYRKHPAEIIDSNYEELLPFISNNKNLMDDLNEVKVVVGDVSSVMLEAALVNKNVVQIVWSERSKVADTPLYSFTFKTDSQYQNIQNTIEKAFQKQTRKVDKYYLWVNENFELSLRGNIRKLLKRNNR